jgi:hypothetical protein
MHVSGQLAYFLAARQSLASLVERTPFEILVAAGPGARWTLPKDERIRICALTDSTDPQHRAAPFLQKFRAIRAAAGQTAAKYLIVLDADALVVRRLDERIVEQQIAGYRLAMAEQPTIRGSAMGRPQFLDHYCRHSLAWIAPEAMAPDVERFRFFNSGVVLGLTEELGRLGDWALETIRRTGPEHRVGQHMVADQDYFQVWANSLHPGSCRTLGWEWNHCEHWDDKFPRRDAYVLHYSNFCQGPTARTLLRMATARFVRQ